MLKSLRHPSIHDKSPLSSLSRVPNQPDTTTMFDTPHIVYLRLAQSLRLLSPKRLTALMIALAFLLSSGFGPLDAEAKKKDKKGGGESETKLKEELDPMVTSLNKLMVKVQSRAFLSPQEAGNMSELTFKLMSLINDYPKSTLLIQPVYQAGILCKSREQYDDAFELFSFLAYQFPESPYGLRSQGQIQQMRRALGADALPESSIYEALAKSPGGKDSSTKKKG